METGKNTGQQWEVADENIEEDKWLGLMETGKNTGQQ
jgi:hypothetical protein